MSLPRSEKTKTYPEESGETVGFERTPNDSSDSEDVSLPMKMDEKQDVDLPRKVKRRLERERRKETSKLKKAQRTIEKRLNETCYIQVPLCCLYHLNSNVFVMRS